MTIRQWSRNNPKKSILLGLIICFIIIAVSVSIYNAQDNQSSSVVTPPDTKPSSVIPDKTDAPISYIIYKMNAIIHNSACMNCSELLNQLTLLRPVIQAWVTEDIAASGDCTKGMVWILRNRVKYATNKLADKSISARGELYVYKEMFVKVKEYIDSNKNTEACLAPSSENTRKIINIVDAMNPCCGSL